MKKLITIIGLGASIITAPAFATTSAAAAQHERTTQVSHPAPHCVPRDDTSVSSAYPAWELC